MEDTILLSEKVTDGEETYSPFSAPPPELGGLWIRYNGSILA